MRSDIDLNYFRKRLEKRLNDITTGQQQQKGTAPVELDQARVGRLSRMDAMQAQAMSVETGRRRRQLLVEIDAALERVMEGYYGDCLECDESIHPGRLEANPSATLCISCAEAQE